MKVEKRAESIAERLSELENAALSFAEAQNRGDRKWRRVELARQAVRYTAIVRRARTDRDR